VVLGNSAERRHHCQPIMLNLIASFIAFLREARWVKKPTGAIAPSWLVV
jgi:hypothetical protein